MTPPLIVLVEDEEHLAQGLLFNLQAEGYRTHHESDGDAALAYLLAPKKEDPKENIAAIVLDCMLPGADYNVGRFFADAEALYSYEGTFQMQNLILGKAITGFSAFV